MNIPHRIRLAKITLLLVALICGAAANAKDLTAGWNLLGNSFTQPIAVSMAFSDSTVFSTVWAWDGVNSIWRFYTPAMTTTELQTYADSKGYGVLSQIQPEDGYWVNAKIATTLTLTPTCANGALDYPTCTPPATGTTPTIAQGGLTWVFLNGSNTYNWSQAAASCSASSLSGFSD